MSRLIFLILSLLVSGYATAVTKTAYISTNEDTAVSVYPSNYGVGWDDYNSTATNPAHGSMTISRSANRFRYTPDNNYCGSDYSKVTVTTSSGGGGGGGGGEPGSPTGGGSISVNTLHVYFTVNCVADAPTITNIGDQSFNEDTSNTINFTVTDAETSNGSLTLTKSSSNTTLIPTGNIVFGGSGSARTVTLTPAANKSGTATITLTVSDGSLTKTDSFVVTINSVNDAPVITQGNSEPLTVTEDINKTITLSATDVDSSTLTWSILTQGTKGVASGVGTGSSRTLTYNPNSNATGSDTFVVKVSDGTNSALVTINVTITAVNDAPVIAQGSSEPLAVTEDINKSLALSVTDVDSSSFTWSIHSQGSKGVATASGTGASKTVTYDPNSNATGGDTFIVKVSDGSKTDTISVTVTIAAVNDAPIISQGASEPLAVIEDINKTLALNASDVDSSTLTWSISSQGTKGTAIVSGTGTSKTVTYDPNSNVSGTDSFVVKVSDGSKTDTITVNVTIAAINDSPVIAQGSTEPLAVTEDINKTLTLNASDVDSGTLTWSINTQGTKGVATVSGTGASKTVTYDPNSNATGTDTFVVKVSDGSKTDTITINVTITAVNDAPVITQGSSEPLTVTEDINKTLILNATDVEGSTLTWSINSQGTKGVATASGTGTSKTITYNPNSNATGTDTYVVKVSDGSKTDTITVNVTITAVNDAPVITQGGSQSLTVTEDINKTLTLNATDVEGSTLTWSINSQGTKGVATASGTGASKTITYNPNSNATGTDTYVVKVSDGSKTDTITINVTITAVNDAPVITQGSSEPLTVTEDINKTLILNATDVEGSTLTWSINSQGTKGVATASGTGTSKTITYNPNSNATGTDSYVVKVSDGSKTDTITVNVTITAVNDAPVISQGSSEPLTVTEDINKTLTLNATDVEGSTITWSINSQGTKGVATASGTGTSKTITYNPNTNVTGTDSFVVKVSDGSKTDTITVNVTIIAVNDEPVITQGTSKSLTVTEDINKTLTLNATDVEGSTLTWSINSQGTKGVATASGTGASKTVTYDPNTNATGTDSFVVKVSDGGETDSITVNVTITAVDDTPTITNVGNQSINEDSNKTINITVTDVETADGSLTLSKASSNTTLIPTSNIVIAGSGSNRTVTVTPLANKSGSSTITLTVSDGSLTQTDSFVVTVNEINDTPTISSISDQIIYVGSNKTINFSVTDIETADGSLTLTKASTSTTIIPTGNIVFGGSDSNRTVLISPDADNIGTTTITLTVSDGSLTKTESFEVTVALPLWAQKSASPAIADASLVSVYPADQANIGAIEYKVSNSGGAASYSIPVAVPPGRKGMHPSVAISYSSRGGNDIAGQGWSLSTGSRIARCGKIWDTDDESSAVLFNDEDKLCLDGVRLKLSSSAGYWVNNATYHPETDPTTRVTYSNGAFIVERKNGLYSVYGLDASSRIQPSGLAKSSSWLIDYSHDRNDNFIHYSYNSFGDLGNLYLQTIHYTGNGVTNYGSRQVDFSYEQRPDNSFSYHAGGYSEVTRRLKSITTSLDNGLTDVSMYSLTYKDGQGAISSTLYNKGSESITATPQIDKRKSVLDSIEQCNWDGQGSKNCLPKTYLDMQLWQTGLNSAVQRFPFGDSSLIGQGMVSGDFDGDAELDFMFIKKDNFTKSVTLDRTVYFADGSTVSVGALGADKASVDGLTIDYNGDNVMEIASAINKADNLRTLGIAKYDGVSQFTITDTGIDISCQEINTLPGKKYSLCQSYPVDFDNDGLTDLLIARRDPNGLRNIYWQLYRNESACLSGYNESPSCDTNNPAPNFVAVSNEWQVASGSSTTELPFELIDIDGDGKVELYGHRRHGITGADPINRIAIYIEPVISSPGSWQFVEASLDQTSWDVDTQRLIDINNDGLIDLLSHDNPNTNDFYVRLNQGDGTLSSAQLVPIYTRDSLGNLTLIAGDALADLLTFKVQRGEVFDYNNDGLSDYLFPNNLAYSQDCPTPEELGYTPEGDEDRYDSAVDDYFDCASAASLWDWYVLQTEIDDNGNPRFIKIDENEFNLVAPKTDIRFLDINADGATDIVTRLGHEDTVDSPFLTTGLYAYLNPNAQADIMVKATSGYTGLTPDGLNPNGLDRIVEFSYESLAELQSTGEYTLNADLSFPYSNFTTAAVMLAEMKKSNGVGGLNSTQWRYWDARYHRQGRGFQGFSRMDSWQKESNKRNSLEFEVAFPFSGKVKESYQFVDDNDGASGKLISQSSILWAENDVRNATLTYPQSKTTATYALDIVEPIGSSTNEIDSIDDYGNVTESTATVDNGFSVVESQTLNDFTPADEAIWWVNKLNYTEVTTQTITGSAVRKPSLDPVKQVRTDYTWVAERLPDVITTTPLQGGGKTKVVDTDYNDHALPALVETYESGFAQNKRTIATTYSDDGDTESIGGYFPYQITNDLGHMVEIHTNPADGQVTTQIDANNLVTSTLYDAFGRVLQVTPPIGQPAYSRYALCDDGCDGLTDSNIRYKVTIMQAGSPASIAYKDKLNRTLVASTEGFDGSLIYVQTDIDTLGRTTFTSVPSFNINETLGTRFNSFDPLGRPLQKVVDQPDNQSMTIDYNYNYDGNDGNHGFDTHITATAAGKSLTMTRTHSTAGQLMKTTQSDDGQDIITQYAYDAMGNPIVLRDGNDNDIDALYNAWGEKEYVNDPNMGLKTFTYTGFGEVNSETDANGDVTSYAYDDLGRLYERKVNGILEASFGFDSHCNGILDNEIREDLSASDVYQRSYTYNANCQLTNVMTNIDNDLYDIDYFYDSEYGRLKGASYPTELTVETLYNDRGYVTQSQNATSGYVYHQAQAMNARGQLTLAQKANGALVETASYSDESGQMESIFTSTVSGGNQRHKIDYSFDGFGNLDQQIVENIRSGNVVVSTENYDYDDLHRLINSTRVVGGISLAPITYDYDAVGNLKYKDDYASNYVYGNGLRTNGNAGPNAVYQVNKNDIGAISFSYDNNGNLRTGDGKTLTYNAFNKPLSVSKNGITSDFFYGSDQMRYKQVKTGLSGGDQTFIYVDKTYEEIRYNGTVQKKLYLGDTIITEEEASGSTSFDIAFVHRDRLNSVVTLTDQNGNVIDNKSYDPFGKPRKGTMENVDPADVASLKVISGIEYFINEGDRLGLQTRRGFTDHEHLDDAELIHMNGRVYDYNLGRFLSVDPFIQEPGNSQSMNPYSYIMNNPLAGIDPSGYLAFNFKSACKISGDCNSGSAGAGSSTVDEFGMTPDGNGGSVKAIKNTETGKITITGKDKAEITTDTIEGASVISTQGGTGGAIVSSNKSGPSYADRVIATGRGIATGLFGIVAGAMGATLEPEAFSNFGDNLYDDPTLADDFQTGHNFGYGIGFWGAAGLAKSRSTSMRLSSQESVDLLVSQGLSKADAADYIASFSGPITSRAVQKGETFIRYSDQIGDKGSFMTKSTFSTPQSAIDALYLSPYGNSATFIQTVTATKSSIVLEGGVAYGGKGINQALMTNRDAFSISAGTKF